LEEERQRVQRMKRRKMRSKECRNTDELRRKKGRRLGREEIRWKAVNRIVGKHRCK
jgi:hypothetical protein